VLSQEGGELWVDELSAIVSLYDFDWEIILGANIRMISNKCIEDIILMFERKGPTKMSKIIK
jgi:hypothetical protein